jgi:hypothetical protein
MISPVNVVSLSQHESSIFQHAVLRIPLSLFHVLNKLRGIAEVVCDAVCVIRQE